MKNSFDLHVSIDEARSEIIKRWQNKELREKIERELGKMFISDFKNFPRAVSFRQLCSPDNGFTFFFQCANYIGAKPLITEFHDDVFVHFNEEKKGLGRLRVILDDGSKAIIDIMNFHENEKKRLGDAVIKTGEKLIDFHHKLFEISQYNVDIEDKSKWFKEIGPASEYYYYYLLHFVAHGILFENLYEGDSNEVGFSDDVIIPGITKIKENFGLNPLIVKSYPDNQTEEEDFYWWSYPPYINDYIIKYSQDNGIPFKKLK